MFSIKSVELQGFKSFVEKQSFDFPTQPGLYFVTGQNKQYPRLGANGVGKSTFLDAIFWCLYGRTPRGLKASDIVTRGGKSAYVIVDVDVGTDHFTIERRQAPNALLLNAQPADQDAIDGALRLNAGSFEASIMRPQFGGGFLQLKPAEKLALFSELLELDMWLEKSKVAADLVKELDHESRQAERERESYVGKIELLSGDIESLRPKEQSFTLTSKAEIQKQRDLIIQAKSKLVTIDAEIERLNTEYQDLEFKATEIDSNLKGADARLGILTGSIGKVEGTKIGISRARREAETKIGSIPKQGVECPNCLQSVPSEHRSRAIKALKEEVEKLSKAQTNLETQLIKHDREKQELIVEIRNLKYDLVDTNSALTSKLNLMRDLKHESTQLAEGIKLAKATIVDLNKSTNPYTAEITEKKSKLGQLKTNKAKLDKTLNDIGEEALAVGYWINGFKRLRLMVIDQTLKALEIEINNNLASLGMPEWAITLDVERENKSGGVTKGFSVFVHAPGGQAVRFEAWSGGETQRLCLAGDMGLSNLILERAGLNSDIEFYDEPSAHMSTEGLHDLAETLAQRAEDQGKRIFLIDHTIIDFAGFAGTIRIIKDSSGSSLDFSP